MKILLLTENWPPRVGGIERYLTNLVKELRLLNHEVEVIAPQGSTGGEGITARRFFWPIIKPAWLPLYWHIARKAKRKEIDMLLCGKGLFEGLLGYKLNKKYGVPYIVFTYAMEIEEWEKTKKKKLIQALTHAQSVVYINDHTKSKLEALGVTSDKLVEVQPGVEETYLNASENGDVLEKYDIEKPYIIIVARLIPRKGVDDLITAYSKLEQTTLGDVQLVIVGEGPEKERLQQLSRQLFVQPKFLGHVDEADLPALLAGASVFALTPKNVDGDIEGFGIVYLEANAAGTPVIGTKHGGVPGAVVDNETGLLVEEGDADGIKGALEKLLLDTTLAIRLGDEGQKRARQRFIWKVQAKKLDLLLQR